MKNSTKAAFSAVEAAFGLKATGEIRTIAATHARFAVMALLREQGISLPSIGKAIGRHHSSVLVGIRKAYHLAERNAGYAASLDQARKFILAPPTPTAGGDFEAPGPEIAKKLKRPPAVKPGRLRTADETFEDAETRAMVEKASRKLGELLAREAGR